MLLRAVWAAGAVFTSFSLVSCSAVLGFDTLTMGSSSDAGTPDVDAAALVDASGEVGTQDATDAPADVGTDASIAIDCTTVHVTTLAGTMLGFADGVGSASLFSTPIGIMVDSAGTILVADSGNGRVRQVLADGTTSTYSQVPSTLLQPTSVALTPTPGLIWVADSANDALEQVNAGAGGAVTTVFNLGGIVTVGSAPSGTTYVSETQTCGIYKVAASVPVALSGTACGFQDGPAVMAKYETVRAFAFDADDTMYAADTANYRIRKVSAGDGSVITFAGSVQGHVDAVGAAARFDGPTGITMDRMRHVLYVADGNTIRIIYPDGRVATLVGSTSGTVDGDGCHATFAGLQGIAYFNGALYVTDAHRVRKVVLP